MLLLSTRSRRTACQIQVILAPARHKHTIRNGILICHARKDAPSEQAKQPGNRATTHYSRERGGEHISSVTGRWSEWEVTVGGSLRQPDLGWRQINCSRTLRLKNMGNHFR